MYMLTFTSETDGVETALCVDVSNAADPLRLDSLRFRNLNHYIHNRF